MVIFKNPECKFQYNLDVAEKFDKLERLEEIEAHTRLLLRAFQRENRNYQFNSLKYIVKMLKRKLRHTDNKRILILEHLEAMGVDMDLIVPHYKKPRPPRNENAQPRPQADDSANA